MNANVKAQIPATIFNMDVPELLSALSNVFHLSPIECQCAMELYQDKLMSFQAENSANERWVSNMSQFEFSIFSSSLMYKIVQQIREMSISVDGHLNKDIQMTFCDPQQKRSLIDEMNANLRAGIAMK